MRVADKMMYNQVTQNLGKNRHQMSELQNQASTQKRVTKPSDDPVAASRVLTSRVDLRGNEQYLKSLEYARAFLEFTDQSLGELSENLMRAKELALSQSSDASANEQSRRVTASEVEQIFNQAVQVGNRKHGDRFIFGGYKTTHPPFDPLGRYKGDSGQIMIPTDKGAYVAMNLPGDYVFHGQGLGASGGGQLELQAESIDEFIERRDSQPEVEMRGPASVPTLTVDGRTPEDEGGNRGVNVFQALKHLEIGLRTNDKGVIQDSLVVIDEALNQVVMSRAQAGSRVTALENVFESLHKARVDNKVSISQLEDADIFEVISDMNKTEATLQATLATSGKLIQPSLLDFLR